VKAQTTLRVVSDVSQNGCAPEHGMTPEVEVIPMQDIHVAYERMLKSDVKYRFVIDLASLRQPDQGNSFLTTNGEAVP
jgi:hypothetical protein